MEDKTPEIVIKEEPHTYVCISCQGGVRQLRYLTYHTWFKRQMITVPNFPAWVCDMCGECEFDERAVEWLHTVLTTPQIKKKAKTTAPRQRGQQVDYSSG